MHRALWALLASWLIVLGAAPHGGECRQLSVEEPEEVLVPGNPLLQPAETPKVLWEVCQDVPRFGPTCIGVYTSSSHTSALGVELTLLNTTYYIPLVESVACLDDATLLALLMTSPELLPFAKQIKALIVAERMVGSKILSECVIVSDVNITNADVSGCAELQSRFLCRKHRCLMEGDKQFGCFKVPIPKREDSREALAVAFGHLPKERPRSLTGSGVHESQ